MRLLAYGAEVAADPGLLAAFRDAHPSGTLIVHCPSTEAGLPDQEKERIARVYQGREWRALARGKSG